MFRTLQFLQKQTISTGSFQVYMILQLWDVMGIPNMYESPIIITPTSNLPIKWLESPGIRGNRWESTYLEQVTFNCRWSMDENRRDESFNVLWICSESRIVFAFETIFEPLFFFGGEKHENSLLFHQKVSSIFPKIIIGHTIWVQWKISNPRAEPSIQLALNWQAADDHFPSRSWCHLLPWLVTGVVGAM